MAHYEQRLWEPSYLGRTKKERLGGMYRCFVPDMLCQMNLSLGGQSMKAALDAEKLLWKLPLEGAGNLEGIARLLLRSEAVSSSHIEGLEIGARRLLRAELRELDPENVRYDANSIAVMGNIHAMEDAIHLGASASKVNLADILDMHKSLLAGTRLEDWGGKLRDRQNWVGGNSYSPLNAEYVPPPPENVPILMKDLVDFINRDDIPVVIQAALVHSQFETIHPFVDGNGRTGRALIHIVLARGGVIEGRIPPISLAFATDKDEYYRQLSRMQGYESEEELLAATGDWVAFFSACVVQASEDMLTIQTDLDEIVNGWKRLLPRLRSDSTIFSVLKEIQSTPVFSIKSLSDSLGRSFQATNNAVAALEDAGIVRQTSHGKRNRIYETPAILEEFDIVERRLASPSRDTTIEPPVRPVPYRRR